MSAFVELPPNEYAPDAFKRFDAASTTYRLDNARGLMWFSQLAYETAQPATISAVHPLWGFTSVTPFTHRQVGLGATFDTTGLIGVRPDAVVLAFAGTDPGVWETIATDANLRVSPQTNVHEGFQAAAAAVAGEIQGAIAASRNPPKPLFITGHSLGAALAALAALSCVDQNAPPRAVYLFGMPRTGGEQFRDRYDAALGPCTFRHVHGEDIVARVPPSFIGYRHVGRVLQCARGAKFDPAALSAVGTDDPPAPGLGAVLAGGAALFSGHADSPPGPGPLGPLFVFLPPPIRDHLQDRYYTALTLTQ